MGLLDGYKQILQDYKEKVVDEVREKVLGVGIGVESLDLDKDNTQKKNGTDYYSYDGKYLGTDGKDTGGVRIARDEKSNDVLSLLSQLKNANEALKENIINNLKDNTLTKSVVINNQKIHSDIQAIVNLSLEDNLEHVVEIIVDNESENPEVRSRINPNVGTNDQTTVEYMKPNYGGTYTKDGRFLYLAQVHTHPKIEKENHKNLSNVSEIDKQAAINVGIPIYAVDAFEGDKTIQQNIHRANLQGKGMKNVGKTKGDLLNSNFEIGRDALEIGGGKRKS